MQDIATRAVTVIRAKNPTLCFRPTCLMSATGCGFNLRGILDEHIIAKARFHLPNFLAASSKCPSSASKSFGVKCRDRIEVHGAQCRDVAGGERDTGKYKGDTGEGGQIVRRHAVE